MNSERVVLIILGVIGGIALLLLYLFWPNNWQLTYNQDSKEPYGLYIFKEMISQHVGEDHLMEVNSQLADSLAHANGVTYIYIGETYYADSATTAAMLDFVSRGNVALVASTYGHALLDAICTVEEPLAHDTLSPDPIVDTNVYWDPERGVYDTVYYTREADDDTYDDEYYDEEEDQGPYSTHSVLAIRKARVTVYKRNMTDTIPLGWNYFGADSVACKFEPLGTVDDTLANFVQVSVGKGVLLLHSTPIVFTNFFAREDTVLPYYNEIFSHFTHRRILWDEASRTRRYQSDAQGDVSSSPVQAFLKIEQFRWAWYVLLSLLVLVVIFGAKRRQRMIPMIKPKENSSYEFIETIGSLYYQTGDHASLAKLKLRLFNQHLYQRYGTVLSDDPNVISKLAVVSGIEASLLEEIASKQKAVHHLDSVSSDFLITLYVSIEKCMTHGK